jgi:predicted acetyltransferase
MTLSLIEPTTTWQAAFLDMAHEFLANSDLRYQAAITDFSGYLQHLQQFAAGTDLPPGIVREATYWALDDATIVGTLRLRHQLNPALEQIGGHIGYEVRPSAWRQGYGTQMLALALEQAQHTDLALLDRAGVENRRTTEPRNHGTTEPRNHRTTEPQNHRTTEPQNHRTTEPQNHRAENR